MIEHARCEIAVIGAGVVGLTIALRLAQDGHEVVLLDPNMPGSGASYGNAGTIADYAVMPVGTPEDVFEFLAPYVEFGYRHLQFGFPAPYDEETMTRLANEVRPRLEALIDA